MANSTSIQILNDGCSRTILKYEGVLDTSDVAAAGVIGASGFTTAVGSNVVTFVAGALVPSVGQFLTFGDGTTTFNAGTYVTSVVSATSITVSNNAKVLNAAAAVTITGVVGNVVVADPALLSSVDPTGSNYLKASKFRISKIVHNIEDGLSVNFFWEATTNVRVEELVGRGHPDYRDFGGLQNNAGTGITGRLLATTEGWSGVKSFSVILYLTKQW